jgi:hypothetical protein
MSLTWSEKPSASFRLVDLRTGYPSAVTIASRQRGRSANDRAE